MLVGSRDSLEKFLSMCYTCFEQQVLVICHLFWSSFCFVLPQRCLTTQRKVLRRYFTAALHALALQCLKEHRMSVSEALPSLRTILSTFDRNVLLAPRVIDERKFYGISEGKDGEG